MESLLRFGYDILGMDKIAALVILSFIWIAKVAKNRSDSLRDSKYKKVGEMIAELEKNNQKEHSFIVEQVFQNRFGILVDYPIIKFFLLSNTPSKDLYNYVQGRNYIEFTNNYKKLKLKGKLTSKKLKLRSFIYLISYLLSAFLGLYLIAAMPYVDFKKLTNLAVYILFITTCLIWAYLSVEEGSKPSAARDLAQKYNN